MVQTGKEENRYDGKNQGADVRHPAHRPGLSQVAAAGGDDGGRLRPGGGSLRLVCD